MRAFRWRAPDMPDDAISPIAAVTPPPPRRHARIFRYARMMSRYALMPPMLMPLRASVQTDDDAAMSDISDISRLRCPPCLMPLTRLSFDIR